MSKSNTSKKIKKSLEELQQLIDSNEIEQAETLIKELEKNYRKNEQLLIFIGEYRFNQRKVDLAKPYLEKAVKLNPKNYHTKMLLGNCYFIKSDFKKTLEILFSVHDQIPDEKEINYHIAKCYFKQKKYDLAKDYFTRVLNVSPFHTDSIINLGDCAFLEKNYMNALKFYNQAIKNAPENPETYNKIAIIYKYINNIDQAINVLKFAINKFPRYIKLSWTYINIISELNKIDEVIDCLNKLLDIFPNDIDILERLGDIYYTNKNYQEAINYYKKYIEKKSNNYSILNKLGVMYKFVNQFEDSKKAFEYCIQIQPNSPDAYNNLGNLFRQDKQYEKAIESYQQAIKNGLTSHTTYQNLADTLLLFNKYSEALNIYKKVLEKKPDFHAVRESMGDSYYFLKQYKAAIEQYFLIPDYETKYSILNKLGTCYKYIHDNETALKYYEKTIALNPNFYDVYNNLGNIYYEDNKVDLAKKSYWKSVELNPEFHCAYSNLGAIYAKEGYIDKALELYNKALAIKPNYTDALLDMGLVKLMLKDFENGFKLYENRFDLSKQKKPIKLIHKANLEWKGEDLKSKTIYVYHEQGFGDSINFIRYIPLLANKGAKVIFKAQDELEKLFKINDFKAKIVKGNTIDLPLKYDYHIPLLSLPYKLDPLLENIPSKFQYINADPERVKYYHTKYFNNDKFKIGLFWQGSATNTNDKRRSVALKNFYKMTEYSKIKLYSIQKGHGIDDLKDIPENIEIVNLGATFEDFNDTAAAIQNLDLLISIDSAVVHLAGSMAKPVWVLLGYVPDWRWFFSEETDSIWYHTARLFRQKNVGDWDRIFLDIYSALDELNLR